MCIVLFYFDFDLWCVLLQDFESNEGVCVYLCEKIDKFKLQFDELLNCLIEYDICSCFGDDIVIVQLVNDIFGVWISFKIDDDDYWVVFDCDQFDNVMGLQWVGWGLFVFVLLLFGFVFIMSFVNWLFLWFVFVVCQVGLGQVFELLFECGMGVVVEINCSFNQMVCDFEQFEVDCVLMFVGILYDLCMLFVWLWFEIEMSLFDQVIKDVMVDDIEQMDCIIVVFIDYVCLLQCKLEFVDLLLIVYEVVVCVLGEDGVEICMWFVLSVIIEVDEIDMCCVIGNFVENVCKYGQSKQDGILCIMFEMCVLYVCVELLVSDEGFGIFED